VGFSSTIYRSPDGKHRVSVVNGNSKLGHIDCMSLCPGSSCAAGVPCLHECYAMKAWHMYDPTRTAWRGNEKAARENPAFFFDCFDKYLTKHSPDFFRLHVGGDFFSRDYMRGWYELAKRHPGTRFLAFTKQYTFLNVGGRPDNFELVVSAWPGMKLPRTKLPIAYMQDDAGVETRVKNAIRCPGSCQQCGMCFDLRATGKNVVFHEH
jgi:hypothetical protein